LRGFKVRYFCCRCFITPFKNKSYF